MPVIQASSLSRTALHRIAISTLLAFGLLGSSLAQSSDSTYAQTPASSKTPSSTQWGIGLAAGASQELYRGTGNENSGLPLLYVENDWFRFLGATADVKLGTWGQGSSTLGLTGRLKYEGGGYESADSPALTGMADRDGGLWGGATLTWKTPVVKTSLEWLSDASSKSKGQQLQLQVDRRIAFGSLSITPRAQVQWQDKKYVDYYYGVRASEAMPGRPQYTGEAATSYGVGMRFDYQIAPKQTVFLDLSTSRLPNEIKNSPLVERSSVSKVGIGYLYRF
jgi:outer membrane protein